MTWFQIRRSLGYQADMAKAMADEREACADLAINAIRGARSIIRGKEFADGYSLAAQEIYASIAARGLSRTRHTEPSPIAKV